MSAYRNAIDRTGDTLVRRSRYFRNQVIVVVVIGAFAIVWAIVTKSTAPLWALLFLVPACGVFFIVDAEAVNDWRAQLLSIWVTRDANFVALFDAIRANPVLPMGAIDGMLMTLPSSGNLTEEQRLLTPTRKAIAAATLALHRQRSQALLFNVAASAVVVIAVIASIWSHRWLPLAALAALLSLPAIRARGRVRGQRWLEAEVARCRAESDFNEADYQRWAGQLK